MKLSLNFVKDYVDIPENVSLKDLGEMLDNPIGKSGVNHRLQKIHEIAEDLRKGN